VAGPYYILDCRPGGYPTGLRASLSACCRRYHPDLPIGDLRRTQLIHRRGVSAGCARTGRIGYYYLRD